MSKNTDKQFELRLYLLGKYEKQTEKEKIEERLILDKNYLQLLLNEEEELIEDYVDGKLNNAEIESFNIHFLISEKRREKLKFVRLFKEYGEENSKILRETGSQKIWKNFTHFLSSPIPVGLSLLIFISIFSSILFFYYFAEDPQQKVIVSLNEAYTSARPLESRISKFEYAPFDKIRTQSKEKINTVAQDQAKLIALAEVSKNSTSENHHLLGRVYLSTKEFDKALEQLKEAQKNNPQNAEVLNDIGIVYLEKSKSPSEKNQQLQLIAKSIENFDNALKINPNTLSALFNKAIATEIYFPKRSKEAWQEYLKFDPNSKWSDEARERLKILNKSQTKSISTGEELELAFIQAFKKRDDNKAFELASQNRELIKGKYLPHRFIKSIIEKKNEKNEKLKLLKYLGHIERARIGDHFASDIALYYKTISNSDLIFLKKARFSFSKGIEFCLNNDFIQALEQFKIAEKNFLKAGNIIEAKTISLHFIAYCYYNTDQREKAFELFRQVDNFCNKKRYVWFQLMNLDWFIGSQDSLEHKTFTETKENYEAALNKAINLEDKYMTQKFLLSLIRKTQLFKRKRNTLGYLNRLLHISKQSNISERQIFRNFNVAIPILVQSGFYNLAKEIILESISLVEPMSDPLFAIGSQINAGIILTQTNEFELALHWLDSAKRETNKLKDENKQIPLAKIFLQMGHLEKKRKEFQKATFFYGEALEIVKLLKTPVLLYELKKSRLLAYQELGNNQKVEDDLYETIKLAEKYRNRILDEQDRNSFFDNEQDIYDVAVEHNIRMQQNGKAYYYSEISKSRSLFDWLNKKGNVFNDEQKPKVVLTKSVQPLEIDEIRENIPSEVQILQYSILKNKVLIWLITKENFLVFSSKINSRELREEIENYLELIEQKKSTDDISGRLYNILIKPVLHKLDNEKEICLIPDKFLSHLPFSSLISPNKKYLLEDFSLFYSPSANVFIYSTEKAKNKSNFQDEKILGIGNPAVDISKYSKLENLPEAELEVKEIIKNYKHSKLLLGKEATKDSFLKLYSNFQIIHFAGHYIAHFDSPLLSKLVMAENLSDKTSKHLTNIELMEKTLPQTKLIILSACETGVERYFEGEGMIGLSRTFLASEVPLVIASQWKVNSNATFELMSKFHYFRKQKNLSSAKALRKAQLALLNSPNSKFRKVYYWAAFAPFGGYTEY